MKLIFSFIFFWSPFMAMSAPLISTIEAVTVYPNGAKITRSTSIHVSQGQHVLEITGLSMEADENTLTVTPPAGLEILNISHRYEYISGNQYKELNKLRADSLETEIQLLQGILEIIDQQHKLLLNNSSPAGERPFTIAELQDRVAYIRAASEALMREELQTLSKLESLQLMKQQLEKQIHTKGASAKNTTKTVVITSKSNTPVKGLLKLSYFQEGANWYPKYNLRITSLTEPVQVEYKALITNHTGERWENTTVKLATGQPTSNKQLPELKVWQLGTKAPVFNYDAAGVGEITGRILDQETGEPLPGAIALVEGTTIGTNADINGVFSILPPNNGMNIVFSYLGYENLTLPAQKNMQVRLQPSSLQLNEIVVAAGSFGNQGLFKKKYRMENKNTDQPVTSDTDPPAPIRLYEIAEKVTLESGESGKIFDINTSEIEALYEYIIFPKAEAAAFLVARLVNTNKLKIPEGEANLFFEGTYLGKMLLNTRQANDTLEVVLGKDDDIAVTYEELITTRNAALFGQKTDVTYSYQLTVKNNKRQPVDIIIREVLPITVTGDIDLEYNLEENSVWNAEKGFLTIRKSIPEGALLKLVNGFTARYSKSSFYQQP